MTATLDAPSDAPVNEVGKERRRKEDAHLITGRTRWTDNIVLPGMLHLALLRSPYAHANITSISVAGAAELPGVVGALDRGGLPGAGRPALRLADYR